MLKNSTFEKWIGTSLGDYRIEQFIEQSNWGPVFLARINASTSGYLLRFLIGSANQSSRSHELYLERFQYQASQIAALQHPNILPLIDFGAYRGLPYLLSPQMSMRSLLSRLDKSGSLDVFTIGRYLDQIATALEYWHEHAVLHESLSVDCVFIRLDGQLVVADFGVRKLLESDRQDAGQNLIKGMSDVTAPEQLLGKPSSPATDVYALAASRNTVAIGCVGQSILDIIEGKHGSHYKQLDETCTLQNVTTTGDGFGLRGKGGYLTGSTSHAGYAISQPDATSAMHVHTARMDVSLANINGWLTTIDQVAFLLATHPTNVSKVEEVVRLADYAYHGVDANGDGQIDPVPGEAGAITALEQGQLIATLTLNSGQ